MRSILFLVAAMPLATSLLLPSMWGSSMVLQRDIPNTIWGLDTPGASVTTYFAGGSYPATCDSAGRFAAKLPAQPASIVPITILVNSSSGASLALTDILFGDVVVISGQSNAQSPVGWQIHYADLLAAASSYGATLRLFQVARLDAYANTTAPQTNLTASIPWSRASSQSAQGMSALGYLFGVQAVSHHPAIPIGVIDSSWGGTAIQPWCSTSSLSKCNASQAPRSPVELVRAAHSPDATREDMALAVLGNLIMSEQRHLGLAYPTSNSVLYNSMSASFRCHVN